MSKTPLVLLLAKAFPPIPGGVERYSLELAIAFKKLGARSIVVTQTEGRQGFRWQDGVPVYNVGKGSQFVVFLKMLRVCYPLVRRCHFDLSYATTWRTAIPIILSRPSTPIGVTIHGREIFVPKGILKRLMKFVFSKIDYVFSVSDFTLAEAHRRKIIPAEKGLRNWNGLTLDGSASPSRRKNSDCGFLMFTICRLVARKNIEGAVRAVGILSRAGKLPTGFVYKVAGGGEMFDRLQQIIREEKLDSQVKLLGRISDEEKEELYLQADLFMHPQIALMGGDDVEGFGLVVAEAMAHGVPVIVGKDGGTADFVLHRQTGLVVDGTSTEEIADAISSLLEDQATLECLAKEGQEWVLRNLDWIQHGSCVLKTCFSELQFRSMTDWTEENVERT